MAGAITHLLVADNAVNLLQGPCPELAAVLYAHRPALLLGSVSPDLPYAMAAHPLSGAPVWADRMHYLRTAGVPLEGAGRLGRYRSLDKPEVQAQLAWLAGYIAHCVTDATIHPIVQGIVGPYHAAPTRHRVCEMTQDALLFSEACGYDLAGTRFIRDLQAIPQTTFEEIAGLWFILLERVYPATGAPPAPPDWYQAYTKLLRLATDSELAGALSRFIPDLASYTYHEAAHVRQEHPLNAQDYYDAVPIPGTHDTGPFETVGFNNAINHLLPIWQALYFDVRHQRRIMQRKEQSQLEQCLRNWNLDTGADMDLPDPRVTYWPGATGS